VRRESDWFRQAEKDLTHATASLAQAHFEWTCYAAHQAAEKAVKALLQSLGVDAWGHSITFMLSEAGKEIDLPANLADLAKQLDRHYVPARYPDAHPQGAPTDFYTAKEATAAIEASREVLEFVRKRLPTP